MSRHSHKGFGRRSPSESTQSPHEKDADWGFEHRESERVLEPKLGIILVTALALMFGFVFYQKLQLTPSGSSQAIAGEGEPLAGDGEDALPSAADGANAGSPREHAASGSTFNANAAMNDPFLAADSAPPGISKVGRTARVGPTSRAHVRRTHVREEHNPFASPPNPFSDDADQAAQPPPQSEPDPFGEPADGESASHGSSAFGSAESLDAGLYFEDDSQFADDSSSQPRRDSSDDFASSPWSGDGRASSRPSERPNHRAAQQFGGSAPSEQNPFAAPPPSRERSFDAGRRNASQQEPQAFPSDGFTAPIPPHQHEPNPFANAQPEPRVPAEDRGSEPTENPFFNVPAEKREPLAAPGWETAGGGQDNRRHHPSHQSTTRGLDAPELPGLPGLPAEAGRFADSHGKWDLAPAPQSLPPLPPVEEPTFDFAPAAGHRRVPFEVSVAGGPVPVIGEQVVRVQRNDSLWSISREAYGTAKYVSALGRYNRDRVPDPNKLSVGVKIRIPPPEVLEAQFPELFGGSPRRDASVAPAGGVSSTSHQPRQAGLFADSTGRPHYLAGKSDTLIQIARKCLGRASRWTEILDMNRHQLKNAESLKPGMVLRMPADARPVSVGNRWPPSR